MKFRASRKATWRQRNHLHVTSPLPSPPLSLKLETWNWGDYVEVFLFDRFPANTVPSGASNISRTINVPRGTRKPWFISGAAPTDTLLMIWVPRTRALFNFLWPVPAVFFFFFCNFFTRNTAFHIKAFPLCRFLCQALLQLHLLNKRILSWLYSLHLFSPWHRLLYNLLYLSHGQAHGPAHLSAFL